MNIACHIVNMVYVRPGTKKTPYELWKGKKPIVKYFRIFGSTCFILKDRENVGKFDTRSDEGVFLDYKVLNKRTGKVMETVNVVIDETSINPTQMKVDQLPKSILPSALVSNKVEEDPFLPPTSNADQSSDSSHAEITQEPTFPPPLVSHIEREPSSRV